MAASGSGAIFVGVFEDDGATVAAAGVDGDGKDVSPAQSWQAASISKMIVATAVLQLVDRGLVDLDEPVRTYVDIEMPRSITVRDVLGHRSGIPTMEEQLFSCPTEDTIDQMKERVSASTGPTRRADYSNTNYLLLGYLVSEVTGRDVGAYTRQRIFEPLGMDGTYWWDTQDGPDPYSSDPSSDPGAVDPRSCPKLTRTVGTEGLSFVSTLDDLDTFLRALFGGDLISETALDQMLPSGSGDDGLGVWSQTDQDRGITLYGHFGSREGFSTVAYHDPQNDRSVVAFGDGGVDAEALMWAAWDWAEAAAA